MVLLLLLACQEGVTRRCVFKHKSSPSVLFMDDHAHGLHFRAYTKMYIPEGREERTQLGEQKKRSLSVDDHAHCPSTRAYTKMYIPGDGEESSLSMLEE